MFYICYIYLGIVIVCVCGWMDGWMCGRCHRINTEPHKLIVEKKYDFCIYIILYIYVVYFFCAILKYKYNSVHSSLHSLLLRKTVQKVPFNGLFLNNFSRGGHTPGPPQGEPPT